MSDDRDQTPVPTSPDPDPSEKTAMSDEQEQGQSGPDGVYRKNLRSAVDQASKKDKDPDERALGSEEGHRSEAPDYIQLLREDERES